MKILSLDLATTTGWAYNQPSINGGTWNLKPKRGSSEGMKQIKLRSHLQDFLNTVGKIDLIVYEKPAGRFMTGVISVAELVSVVKVFCEDNNIEYTSYRPTEVKKAMTGKGNSNKQVMLDEAKKRWPNINIIDDNMADAMLMLQMTLEDLSI
jgi:Holliday junction resolvasome RuvABC endonuclease subunit